LLGKKIEILTADSELKPDVAVRKAKKFILEDKVNFISHNSGSHISVALNQVSKKYKTIYINSGGMSDFLQGKEFSRYSFRLCQNAHLFVAALAQMMSTKPYRKYHIICQDYAWGYDVAKAFKAELKNYIPDAEIVGEEFHPIATKDFGPYLNKVMASKADAVFSGNWGADAINLVKQAREMGLKAPFPLVMTHGVDPYIQNVSKEGAVGIHYAYAYSAQWDTPENKDMIARYHEKHKNDEDFLTWWPVTHIGVVICAWQMAFAAVEKAGSLEPEKIIEAFEGFWYKTPVGWWHMRKCDHQGIIPMFGGEVRAGWNPFFNGSIREDVNFPWLGPEVFRAPATESAIPPTPDYNPRCP
jgi:branched-chain amino acid transport system substrate-binding protein